MLTLADLIEAISGQRPNGMQQPVAGATHDSRSAASGMLFVALKGERLDGHDYVGDAFSKGAIAAFVQRQPTGAFATLDLRGGRKPPTVLSADLPVCILVDDSLAALQKAAAFWRRKLKLRVIGITGSVGKTTTKELVAEVLSQRYRTFKSVGNFNNEIGLPLNVLSLNEQHERAVLEMGFYVIGEIALLADVAVPEVGVITNIGTVHAERAGSQEAIYQGKAELVRALPEDGVAILNIDDPNVKRMSAETKAKVFFYGLDPAAELYADEIEGLGMHGVRFHLHFGGETLNVRIPLIGRHSVHTALRAAAVGLVEGLAWGEILAGLRIGNPQLRLVAVRGRNGSLLLDDTYNASPESTVAALNLLEELEGRKVVVLGDMLELGPYEEQGHQTVGNLAARVADVLVTVGPRARTIAATAAAAGLDAKSITQFETSAQATSFLKNNLLKGDVVLVKGSRGVQMEKIVPELEDRSAMETNR